MLGEWSTKLEAWTLKFIDQLAIAFSNFKTWILGFDRAQLAISFQIFVTICILAGITSSAHLWNNLSYGNATPPVALVYIFLLAPKHQGGATLGLVQLCLGILLGGGLMVAVMYITYAANGFNWSDDSTTKAVVFTIFSTVVAGALNMVRWRFELTEHLLLLTEASFFFAGGVGTYYYPNLMPLQMFYTLAFVMGGATVLVVCCWFIFPVPAGRRYRSSIGKALRKLSAAVSALEPFMFGEIDWETGKLKAATGKLEFTGTDEGLTNQVEAVRAPLRAARGALFSTRALQIPIRFEIDLYNSPRIFPRDSFLHTRMCISLALSTATTLIKPLKSGRMDLRLIQQPAIKPRVEKIVSGMEELLNGLAAAVEGKSSWAKPDAALEALDSAWISFLDEAVIAVAGCAEADQSFALRGLAAFLYLLGGRLRATYAALAGAVAGRDPTAVPLTIKRLETTPGWVKSADAFRNPLQTSEAALQALHRAAEGVDASIKESLGNIQRMRRIRGSEFNTIIDMTHPLGARPHYRTKTAWNLPIWVVFGIQYMAAIAIVMTLTVIPKVAKTLFHSRTTDAVLTVAVTWMPNIGDVHRRAFNRVLGTALAACFSYFIIGIVFATSGGTWENVTDRWTLVSFFTALWGAFCCLMWLRYPKYAYAYVVSALTVPLVTLPSMRASSPPWDLIGWRLLNVSIGVLIVYIVAVTVLPLSARRMAVATFNSALESLAALLRQLPAQLTPAEEDKLATIPEQRALLNHKKESKQPKSPPISPPGSPFSVMQPIAGTAAFRQSFFAPIHVAPISLALRAQRALYDIQPLIAPLEEEYLIFSQQHQMPKGVTSTAAYAAQLMLDYLNLTLALKMENGPLGPWHIPAFQHKWMTKVAFSVAEGLDALRHVVTGKDTTITKAIQCVRKVTEEVAQQIDETMLIIEAQSAPAVNGGNGSTPKVVTEVQMEVVLLLYMGIQISEQLRILCVTTARAFLGWDEEAMARVNELTESNESLLSAQQGPEYVMARMLEGNYRPGSVGTVLQEVSVHSSVAGGAAGESIENKESREMEVEQQKLPVREEEVLNE